LLRAYFFSKGPTKYQKKKGSKSGKKKLSAEDKARSGLHLLSSELRTVLKVQGLSHAYHVTGGDDNDDDDGHEAFSFQKRTTH
jgi:hypothetical protein